MPATDPWWSERWHCPVCNSWTTKHHKSRHLQSATHLRMVMLDDLLDSDIRFMRFLANFDPRTFAGVELQIYREMRNAL